MASNPSGPTWYDILGVTPEAGADEIKAAWRDATDKFEPGTGAGQFRLFNEAADVLLDPAKRAEYDAGLAGADAAPAQESTTAQATVPITGPILEKPAPVVEESAPVVAEPAPLAEQSDPSDGDAEVPPGSETDPAAENQGVSREARLVAVLAVLAVASLVLAAIFGIRLQHRVSTRQDDASAAAEASAVASRALTAVLSYDYRHMDADRDRSAKFLTPKYRKDYLKTFDLLTQGPNGTPGGAQKTKAVVTATVQNTAVQDAGADKVRVLVFVNQASVKGGGTPAVFQNRVVATMVKRGDDWLIDDVKSY